MVWPFVAAGFLAACAPQVAPTGPESRAPALKDSVFETSDGLSLPLRHWLPDGKPEAVVLAVHGFNDYGNSFDIVPGTPGVGPALAAQGLAVYAYDQRGFGAAPHAGLWPGEDRMIGDFADLATELRAKHKGLPLYAVGVSMGGAVIISAMTSDALPPVDAVVLVAPAVWGDDTMPLPYRTALWASAYTFPWASPSGAGLGRQASDNFEMLRANAADPLFIKETRIDSIYGLTKLMDRAQDNVAHLPVPALYVYGANDEIIPKDATILALERFLDGSPHRRFGFYDDGWHMMLRDLQAEMVITDIAAYFKDQQQPLPSGAHTDAFNRLKAHVN